MTILNSEQERLLLKEALDEGSYPKKLYKYRTIEQAEAVLDNLSFWFAKPSSFNDPFDCSLSEVEMYTKEDLQNFIKRTNLSKEAEFYFNQLLIKKPLELRRNIIQIKKEKFNKYGVLSLSKVNDNILMWSHYGNNHEGIVFGLDVEKDIDFFLKPINIEYEDNYNLLNYLKDADNATQLTLKLKASQWAYEEEVRVYKKIDSSNIHTEEDEKRERLKAINNLAIREIYFGVKASTSDMKKIKNLCAKNGLNHIKFYQGSKKHGAFEIEFEEIKP